MACNIFTSISVLLVPEIFVLFECLYVEKSTAVINQF